MYYSNGDIYEGQWENDKPNGEGMLRLSECPAPAGPAPARAPASAASPAFELRFRHLSSLSRTGAETLLEGIATRRARQGRAGTGVAAAG